MKTYNFAKNIDIDANSQFDLFEIYGTVNQTLENTYQYLSNFRSDKEYTEKLKTAFGNDFDEQIANQLFDKFAQGDFIDTPNIKIVNRSSINGANGAFSQDTNLIYLASEFLTENENNIQAITDVLLEETGHFIDAQINRIDTAGDEGDIFARLVQGKILSEQELAVLRAEDDSATVTLDGQIVEIEQSISTITFDEKTYKFNTPTGFSIDPTQKTIFLIHGFTSNPDTFSNLSGGNLYNDLQSLDQKANIIRVDWSSISGKGISSYNWVLERIDDVGWALSDTFKTLKIDPNNTELVGHSLGAHIAGIAGYDYKQDTGRLLNQIVGLDAAGVLNGHLGNDVRLTTGDAKRVVGIHSSNSAHFGPTSEALGWYDQYGDIDIYLYTDNFTSEAKAGGKGPGQLLGSGAGDYRNNHGFAKDFYQMLVKGDKYGSTTGWYWDEWRFTNSFNVDSLSSLQGQHTVSVEHPLGYGRSIIGTYGDNILKGLGGNDTLWGGAGNDTLWGGAGDDFLDGEQGNDWLSGESGRDTVRGGDGNDTVYGGWEANPIGDSANDTLWGGAGDDFLDGEQGNDWLSGESGRDTVRGGDGNDTVYGGWEANPIGDSANDTLWGGAGDDFLDGEQGNDWLSGELGRDTVRGGDGNDTVYGGWEANPIGDSANDTLWGGAGDDLLGGEQGNDILNGGTGADRFLFNSVSDGIDTITDFSRSEADKIQIGSSFGATSITQFIYNNTTGALSFNGTHFATLNTNSNFMVAQDIIFA